MLKYLRIRTDDWEQRKLTELLTDSKGAIKIGPFGSALKKEFYTSSGIKVYEQENVFNHDFKSGSHYISAERYHSLKSCELFPGDIVLSMMGTIGAVAIFTSDAEKGIMNSHLLRLQVNESVIPQYIATQIQDSPNIKNQMERLSVGSIMSGLSSKVIKKLVFPVTSIQEQSKIVQFLSILGNTIALHQRKYIHKFVHCVTFFLL